jgi:hypothetical protein
VNLGTAGPPTAAFAYRRAHYGRISETQQHPLGVSLRQLSVGRRQSGQIELAVVIALPVAHRHTCPGFVGATGDGRMQIASQLTALFLYCMRLPCRGDVYNG